MDVEQGNTFYFGPRCDRLSDSEHILKVGHKFDFAPCSIPSGQVRIDTTILGFVWERFDIVMQERSAL